MEPFLSELPYHIYDWLIISLKDFCIVIRKWPTFLPSRTPLSKRRENSRLILFYKIINNLAVVPHSCLEKADVRTRKKHSQKFRHIGYNIDPYGQSFFPNCISAWNGLAKDIAEANTLDIFKSKLQN